MARTKGTKETKPRKPYNITRKAKKAYSGRMNADLLNALKEAAESGAIDNVNTFIEKATEGAAKASKIYNPKNN